MSFSTAGSAAKTGAIATDVDDRVGFLSLPESYPEHPETVSVIQTHHAWVFLTNRHAYKMKKSHRHGGFDFSTLESRRQLCEDELRLNRRLARSTYLAVVPVTREPDGRFRLNGDGRPVEWLVKMRRLPLERMLPVMAAQDRLGRDDIDRVLDKLAGFYEAAPACRVGDESYAARLEREIGEFGDALVEHRYGIARKSVERVVQRLGECVADNAERLTARQRRGFVIEAHGDLRPEHVCLLPERDPEIIDCLEFDVDLRCLDRVEELAYFGLECRVLGQSWIEEQVISGYQSRFRDRVPRSLWHFYAARRGLVRAMLSARHALDPHPPPDWQAVARGYLDMADDDAVRALSL
jgi:aminoglycoside phosphotransferase family enzyme